MPHSGPRLLIDDWLPAAAIGVECMRERGSASALAPHTYLHVLVGPSAFGSQSCGGARLLASG